MCCRKIFAEYRGFRCFFIQMAQNFFDDIGIFNSGDDPHRTATHRTHLNVDTEHPLQRSRKGHGGI